MASGSVRLGGVSEVAAALGISAQRVRVLRGQDSSGFPEPVAELSAGPVWDLDVVERWDSARPGPGRRPRNILGGRFELEDDPIGSGGFADVFRAVDRESSGDVVAVKVLRQVEHGDGISRFRRELRLLQDLDHQNVIPVLATGVDPQGRPWYVMPLAVGNLHDVLGDVETEQEIIEIMLQVCAGLRYLHGVEDDEGTAIFHRDLCPRNILRTSESTWAIADFGLAREAERRSVALTNSSVILGHIQYLAPEQLSGLKFAEGPADIYSLGRTLLALILGRDPVVGEVFEEDSPFRPIIKRATKQDPSARYQDVEHVVADLLALQIDAPAQWESPAARLERLHRALAETKVSSRVLDEFRQAVIEEAANRDLYHRIVSAISGLHAPFLEYLFDSDIPATISMLEVWRVAVESCAWDFSFCDDIADFGDRVVQQSNYQDEVLDAVLSALVEMGASHNRWHVRSVVVQILQRIKTRDRALVASAALRQCRQDAVDWTITDFARSSLHPLIRESLAS